MKNRYLVFCFNDYYPGGGMDDCEAKCETMDEVLRHFRVLDDKCVMIIEFLKYLDNPECEWYHWSNYQIYDTQNDEVLLPSYTNWPVIEFKVREDENE